MEDDAAAPPGAMYLSQSSTRPPPQQTPWQGPVRDPLVGYHESDMDSLAAYGRYMAFRSGPAGLGAEAQAELDRELGRLPRSIELRYVPQLQRTALVADQHYRYQAAAQPTAPAHLPLSMETLQKETDYAFSIPPALEGDRNGSRFASDEKRVEKSFDETLLTWVSTLRDVNNILCYEIYGRAEAQLHFEEILATAARLTHREVKQLLTNMIEQELISQRMEAWCDSATAAYEHYKTALANLSVPPSASAVAPSADGKDAVGADRDAQQRQALVDARRAVTDAHVIQHHGSVQRPAHAEEMARLIKEVRRLADENRLRAIMRRQYEAKEARSAESLLMRASHEVTERTRVQQRRIRRQQQKRKGRGVAPMSDESDDDDDGGDGGDEEEEDEDNLDVLLMDNSEMNSEQAYILDGDQLFGSPEMNLTIDFQVAIQIRAKQRLQAVEDETKRLMSMHSAQQIKQQLLAIQRQQRDERAAAAAAEEQNRRTTVTAKRRKPRAAADPLMAAADELVHQADVADVDGVSLPADSTNLLIPRRRHAGDSQVLDLSAASGAAMDAAAADAQWRARLNTVGRALADVRRDMAQQLGERVRAATGLMPLLPGADDDDDHGGGGDDGKWADGSGGSDGKRGRASAGSVQPVTTDPALLAAFDRWRASANPDLVQRSRSVEELFQAYMDIVSQNRDGADGSQRAPKRRRHR